MPPKTWGASTAAAKLQPAAKAGVSAVDPFATALPGLETASCAAPLAAPPQRLSSAQRGAQAAAAAAVRAPQGKGWGPAPTLPPQPALPETREAPVHRPVTSAPAAAVAATPEPSGVASAGTARGKSAREDPLTDDEMAVVERYRVLRRAGDEDVVALLPRAANVRAAELRQRGYQNLVEWNLGAGGHRNIYVGRDMSLYVPGAVGTKWGNPNKLKTMTANESLTLYEQRIRSNVNGLWDQLEELAGATEIGCWCKPKPCHCDVLVFLLHEKLMGKAAKGQPLLAAATSVKPAPTHVDPTSEVPSAAAADLAAVPLAAKRSTVGATVVEGKGGRGRRGGRGGRGGAAATAEDVQ